MNSLSTENFDSCETILCDIIMVDTYYYTFEKTHRKYNTESEPECKTMDLG